MLLVAIAQFNGLMLTRRGAARNRGTAHRSTLQNHIGFDSWIAARVQNLARVNGGDFSHIAPQNFVLKSVVEARTAIHRDRIPTSRLDELYKF